MGCVVGCRGYCIEYVNVYTDIYRIPPAALLKDALINEIHLTNETHIHSTQRIRSDAPDIVVPKGARIEGAQK